MPEWVLSVLFFLAVVLSAAKLDEDFGDRGLAGYAMLIVLTTLFAGAVGVPYL